MSENLPCTSSVPYVLAYSSLTNQFAKLYRDIYKNILQFMLPQHDNCSLLILNEYLQEAKTTEKSTFPNDIHSFLHFANLLCTTVKCTFQLYFGSSKFTCMTTQCKLKFQLIALFNVLAYILYI